MLKTKFQIGVELEMEFLRYFVIPNQRDKKRSSLLLEFTGEINNALTIIQCWIELGDGHLYAKGEKQGTPLPHNNFRLHTDKLALRWFRNQGIKIRNPSEAHSGFTKQMKRHLFTGIVRQEFQKSKNNENSELKFRTHISVLTARTKEPQKSHQTNELTAKEFQKNYGRNSEEFLPINF